MSRELRRKVFGRGELLQRGEIGAGEQTVLGAAFGVIFLTAPGETQAAERYTAAAAAAATAQRIVFKQAQALDQPGEMRLILFAKHIENHTEAESGARWNAFKRTRIRLRGNTIDGVFALYFGQLVVQVLAHLGRNAIDNQWGVVYGKARGSRARRLDSFPAHTLYAAR